MLETPHALVGMAVVTLIPNPLISLPLVLISHFIVDMLPHWNWKPDTRPLSLLGIILDLILLESIAVYLIVRSSQPIILAAGSFFAILPDLLEAPHIFLGFENKYLQKLLRFQKGLQNNVSVLPGIITQVLLAGICLLILRP